MCFVLQAQTNVQQGGNAGVKANGESSDKDRAYMVVEGDTCKIRVPPSYVSPFSAEHYQKQAINYIEKRWRAFACVSCM